MSNVEQVGSLAKKIVKGMVDDQADLVRALGLLTESGDVASDIVTGYEMYRRLTKDEIQSVGLSSLQDELIAEIRIFLDLDVAGQQNYLSNLAQS